MIQLNLNGTVGEDFSVNLVQHVLREGGDVKVTLNSGGGYAAEGAAIYAALAAHNGRKRVEIIGIAASAASLIAMAGDEIIMRAGAVMMIHDPMNITVGNSADHAKTIEELEAYATSYAKIYASRAGMSVKAARAIMKAETWFDGEAAVKAGFATATDRADAVAYARYDYDRYRHASQAFATARASKSIIHQAFARNRAHDDAFVVRG